MEPVEEKGSDDIPSNDVPQLRNDMVSAATKFLQNPKVAPRPNSEKEAFLKKKGLTNAEIMAAFEASGTKYSLHPQENALEHYSSVQVARVQGYSSSQSPQHYSRWSMIRDIANAVILLAGAAYGLHYLYKRYISPLLFGRLVKEDKLEKAVKEMNTNITRLTGEVTCAIQNLNDTFTSLRASETQELKAEIASLKGLLLSRRQFPAPPTGVQPSIPSWQLSGTSTEKIRLQSDRGTAEGSRLNNNDEATSLSSSPEIISVEEMPSSNQMVNNDLNSTAAPARDPSESSETGSAEIVDMATGASGEDTD